MISHERCRDQLGEFLDQTLGPSERGEVVSHLETCADCARIARQLGHIRTTLREVPLHAAPPQLRLKVRAQLEQEARPRPRRSFLAWRMSPLHWSGTVAFAMLALMVLARPFANAPLSIPESSAPTESATPNLQEIPAPISNTATPKESTQKIAGTKKTQPVPIAPRTRASTPTAPAPPAVKVLPGPTAPMARRESRPTATEASPAAPIENRTGSPPKKRIPNVSEPPKNLAVPEFPPVTITRARNPIAPPTSFPKIQASAPRRGEAASQSAPKSKSTVAAEARDQNMLVEPQDSSEAPLFAIQLSAVPPPLPAVASAPVTQGDARRADSAHAARKENSETESAAPAGEAAAGVSAFSTREAPSVALRAGGSRAGALEQRQGSPPAVAGAPPPPSGITPQALPIQRFELRFQARRAVSDAQVRLVVEAPLRLVWPGSAVVWRGDLTPEKALQIPFSLAAMRGGGKISVVVEQKSGAAPSRVLETQTLVVPGGN